LFVMLGSVVVAAGMSRDWCTMNIWRAAYGSSVLFLLSADVVVAVVVVAGADAASLSPSRGCGAVAVARLFSSAAQEHA